MKQKNALNRLRKISLVCVTIAFGYLLITALTGFNDDGLTKQVNAAVAVKAFPGAEGYGAQSVGGRGGRVIEVTNLNDSGAGSLRAAINAQGPRTVIFRVGGTIRLRSRLEIQNPYITIAGQTAPGDGIMLRNDPSNTNASLLISTHDVTIRYLRVRPGPSTRKSTNVDALSIEEGYNIIIDHSSFSWATDEVVAAWLDPRDITIQWSIISEGLNCSTHSQGCHSKGLMIGSDGSKRISVHHNLFAHNRQRNPFIKTSGIVDVVNNVIYNPRWAAAVVTDDYAKANVNFVGNYFKRGSNSEKNDLIAASRRTGKGFAIYVEGNITPNRTNDNMSENLALDNNGRKYQVNNRHNAPQITTQGANVAYQNVLDSAGATLPKRDSVDARVVNDVRNGRGQIIDNPAQVGGWPTMRNGTAPADTDKDGMPNSWENTHNFNRNNGNDGRQDADGDGYTNLEEFLNGTNPRDNGGGNPNPPATPTVLPTATPVPAPTATPKAVPTSEPEHQIFFPSIVDVEPEVETEIETITCDGSYIETIMVQEAEEGTLFGQFKKAQNSTASDGQYIWVPDGKVTRFSVRGNTHYVEYTINLPIAGRYRIKGWVLADSGKADSFFVQVDSKPNNGYRWQTDRGNEFKPEYVNHNGKEVVEVDLETGPHTIKVFVREDGTRLDKFEMVLVAPASCN